MLLVVGGIGYGVFFGLVGNWLLFRKLRENHKTGRESLDGIGTVFLLRYLIDGVALVLFALATRDGPGITAAAVSLTIAVKISLFRVYVRKGGRFD